MTYSNTMSGVQLTGHGGVEKLLYRTDLPIPVPGNKDVLIEVLSSSVNNTDINTRIGWYSKTILSGTNEGECQGYHDTNPDDASWTGQPICFPRIQGADCYGRIVEVGQDVDPSRIGQRVLVRTMLRAPVAFREHECWTFGSECDGGFSDYVIAPDQDVFEVHSSLSAEELGAVPCAYGTAEGMLVRAGVKAGDKLLVTGASGGVGLAAVQLAKMRGAEIIAVASAAKAKKLRELGADRVIPRGQPLIEHIGLNALSVVVDLVGGDAFSELPRLLRSGGRYVTAGAIAGPMVDLDLRTLYLNDLTFFGCAAQDDVVFENIVSYLGEGKLRPHIAARFPISRIVEAQELFLTKSFVGKISLVPDRHLG